jgi:hypothetical protein
VLFLTSSSACEEQSGERWVIEPHPKDLPPYSFMNMIKHYVPIIVLAYAETI